MPVFFFLHLNTPVQQVHGQSLVSARCAADCVRHKYTTVAAQISSFTVCLLFACAAAILGCKLRVGGASLTFQVGNVT